MGATLKPVLVETVKLTLKHLETLPESVTKSALHARSLRNLEAIEAWTTAAPTRTERTYLINAVLATHADVMRLVRTERGI